MIIICPNSRILWIPLYFLLEEKKKISGPMNWYFSLPVFILERCEDLNANL